MTLFKNVEVKIHAPETENDRRDTGAVEEALAESDDAGDPLKESESAFIERLETRDGTLHLGVWTETSPAGTGDGWYVSVKIPLLPTKSLQMFLSDLSETLGNFSGRFSVEQVEPKEVGQDGRVSVGTKYAGEEKRIAVLED